MSKRSYEDKILAKAKQIIERRQDEMELKLAIENEPKVDLRKILYYSAYYQGVRAGLNTALSIAENPTKGEERIYLEAEIRNAVSSLRNCQLFLDGTEIRYRNHQRDKKGKLVKCEAYFVERINVIRELV